MRIHGSYQISRSGNIILAKCLGGWNEQCATKFFEDFIHIAVNIDGQWSCITDLSQWQLGTPEIWPAIEKLNSWVYRNKLQYDLIVADSKLKRSILLQDSNNYNKSKIEFFTTTEQAFVWLKQKNIEPTDQWLTDVDAKYGLV